MGDSGEAFRALVSCQSPLAAFKLAFIGTAVANTAGLAIVRQFLPV